MLLSLSGASLRRHPTRTLLAVLGVAVSAALLLDMVMLATGMRESFREFLLVRGFQLRVSPKGTLPFDTEATIAGADSLVRVIRANPDVEAVSPVLGGQLYVIRPGVDAGGERVVTTFALGIQPAEQGDYELLAGGDVAPPDRGVGNDAFFAATGARVGDTLDVAVGFDPQLRSYAGRRRVVVAGRGRFFYTSAGQAVVALPLATVQAMGGADRADRVSLVMAKVRDGGDVERARKWIERAWPTVTAISIETALRQVDERLSYFRQLAFILGAISLVVGFLLVTTLVTVSVNERVGEIAVMRAIGVSRGHVVAQVLVEGVAISAAGSLLGLALGLATARVLNAILADFPGLPAAFDFFLFQPAAAWRALGLLAVSSVLAGAYPAWRASSLPIATTLRQEAVA
ncbi:MAG TPA: FtsX-like permease family protein [Gemmatimonadaceae bacterium]|nr:FtsX-like permease family protein [Gemmatimonadaceae bacterium]